MAKLRIFTKILLLLTISSFILEASVLEREHYNDGNKALWNGNLTSALDKTLGYLNETEENVRKGWEVNIASGWEEEYATLSYVYIINGDFKKAKTNYKLAIKYGYKKTDFEKDYKELKKIYPNKEANLKKGFKIINELYNKDPLRIWKKANYSIDKARQFINAGVKTPKEAEKWKAAGLELFSRYKNDFKKLKNYTKLGITPDEYKNKWKQYKLDDKGLKLLIENKIKITPLLDSILIHNSYYSNTFLLKSKDQLTKNLKMLKDAGCKTIEKIGFYQSDVYDNEGLCYLFNVRLLQRLDRYNGLAIGDEDRDTLWMGRVQGSNTVVHVNFKGSWKEKSKKQGFIKGLGNYKYTTSMGGSKNVSSGKILISN